MYTAGLLSAVHLLALALGFSGIAGRTLAFQQAATRLEQSAQAPELKWIFRADNLWGLAALIWLSSGLWRLFGSLEKPSQWYLGSDLFWFKMSLFGLIFLLELPIMLRLLRWRFRPAQTLNARALRRDARFSFVELLLVLCMVFTASLMARGIAY